jgi:hypothetical protein
VPVVVDGRATSVHPDSVTVEGMEFFDLPGESVIEAQSHVWF